MLLAQRGGGVMMGVVTDEWSTGKDRNYPGMELELTGVTYRNLRSIGIEIDGLRGHAFILADTFLDHLAATSHITVVDGESEERIEVDRMSHTVDDIRQCRAATMAD